MREILFRGKRKDNGEWVEGFYVCAGGKLHYILVGKIHIVYGNVEFIKFIVDPATIGQYTGLKDKNGNRIFEGDIVKRCFKMIRGETKRSIETQVGAVWYMNTECRFCLQKMSLLIAPWGDDTIEVIGNIHDNPELIKEPTA